MPYRLIKISIADHIAHLQLNRPDVFNAMDRAIVDELYTALSEFDENPDVRTIIISGAGKAFCAGGDVSFLQVINSKSQTEIPRVPTRFVPTGIVTGSDRKAGNRRPSWVCDGGGIQSCPLL